MFRKIYKEANDEIGTDEQLLEKILQKAQSGKRPGHNFRAVYSAAAAAVIIIGCSVAYPQLIKQPDTEQSSFVEETALPSPETGADEPEKTEDNAVISTDNASSGDKASMPQNTATASAEQTKKSDKKPVAGTAGKSKSRTEAPAVSAAPEVAASFQPSAADEAVKAAKEKMPAHDEAAAAESVSPMAAEVYSEGETNVASENTEEYPMLKAYARMADDAGAYSNDLDSHSGGAGGAVVASYIEADDESLLSGIDDYMEYIGFDFRTLLEIPDGMEDNSPKRQSVPEEKDGEDYGSFIYSDGSGRKVEINVTKSGAGEIAVQTEGEKKVFGSNSSYWSGEGTSFTVTFLKNSAVFRVISEGLSEKELTAMLTGLITE